MKASGITLVMPAETSKTREKMHIVEIVTLNPIPSCALDQLVNLMIR